MPLSHRSNWLFVLFLVIASALYLGGVPGVPFHPDESTNLFTSADADLFWQQPSALFWRPEKTGDLHQLYRLLDVPVTRNVIAAGRWIAGQPALVEDWDWGKTWQENQLRGALPTRELLLAGRYAIAALFPFTLIFFFLAVKKVSGQSTACTAVVLLATNALVLLHTRRAMAEGGLLFTTTLVMWSLTYATRRPWLNGIPAALALSAKYTLAALAPVGLAATLWQPGISWMRRAGHALAYGALLLLVAALLHPVYWERPVQALQAAAQERMELAAAQTRDHQGYALTTPGKRFIGMIGALYLTPPIFYEAGNYAEETRAAEVEYMVNPLHSLFRSLPAGAILLVLAIFGWAAGTLRVFKIHNGETDQPQRREQKRALALLLAATLVQAAAIYLLVPLAWQRYYLPLVPFSCLWTAYGIMELIQSGFALRDRSGQARHATHLQGK